MQSMSERVDKPHDISGEEKEEFKQDVTYILDPSGVDANKFFIVTRTEKGEPDILRALDGTLCETMLFPRQCVYSLPNDFDEDLVDKARIFL